MAEVALWVAVQGILLEIAKELIVGVGVEAIGNCLSGKSQNAENVEEFLNSVKDTNLSDIQQDAKTPQQLEFLKMFLETKDKLVEQGNIFPSLGQIDKLLSSLSSAYDVSPNTTEGLYKVLEKGLIEQQESKEVIKVDSRSLGEVKAANEAKVYTQHDNNTTNNNNSVKNSLYN